jgi:pSer/pThr/pTyr-binding forkhead associated (FHA) protein
MSEKSTRKMETVPRALDFRAFRARHIASIVVISGAESGSEYILDDPKSRIGRDPDVELSFDDSAMSREHAILEFSNGAFVLRDLGSTNGTRLNGENVMARELDHGDRIEIGEHLFQFVLEDRNAAPQTYYIPDE